MNSRLLIAILFFASLFSGCATVAEIKQVDDKPVENLTATNAKPIQFKKIVVKLKRGEHIGAMKAGMLCIPNSDLTWRGGKISIDSDEFTEAFQEELEKYSFKTVGDTNALFEDPSTWKSEILVAGLINVLRANVCYPLAGFGNFNSSKGEAYIQVEWQIYSKLDRSVVYKVITEGAGKNDNAVAGGDTIAILNAFAQASRNLLADSNFRDIVSRGGQSIKSTEYKSGESPTILVKSSKPVGNTPEEWSEAVVTVFAGSGHGSGFVISDDLILTNHHVVGESNSVSVKFTNGTQGIGKVVASNSGRDVALVKVESTLHRHFRLVRNVPRVGTDVFAIGSPFDEKFHSTVSRGIISGLRQEDNKSFIQSDVNIQPGNSGGPLVDKSGAAIGIAVSGLVVNQTAQGINFFIPIDDALRSLGVF